MKIFNHIDSYLQNESCDSPEPILNGNNRPIIVLDDRETLAEIPRFLLPLQNKIYEVGFPLVTSTDWHREKSLMVKKSLKLSRDNQEISLSIYLQDQVLDSTQLNDEQTHQNLKQELSNRCEHHTADTIAVIVGLFNELYAQSGWDKKFPLLKLPSCLKKLSLEEARQPLVVSLDKRYKLRHNLEILTPKLRSQLNRTVEMTPLSRIQEMDAYCLRDYVRRPGRNAVEKAGSRQQLLSVQRFQNYNTAENRFLKSFCELLQLECQQYNYHPQAQLLNTAINYFYQEPTVQMIQKVSSLLDKPNYVLQENPIYRSFYQAYLDFVHHRHDQEKLWTVRRRLAVDVIGVLLLGSLLNLQGSYTEATANLHISDTPHFGNYLQENSLPIIQCFLLDHFFSFHLYRCPEIHKGDWLLLIKKQAFSSSDQIKELEIPIWVFWYKPDLEIISSIQGHGWVFYLNEPGEQNNNESIKLINNIEMCQLPDPISQNWQAIVNFLTDKICNCVEEWKA